MKKSNLIKLMSLYPPFLGAGISVKKVNEDFTSLDVEMRLTFWNRNYVNTQFGGSLYSMTDPFYMLMLMQNLGSNYIVWDKSASIEFKKPGRGKVFAKFRLSKERVTKIKELADKEYKVEPKFEIDIIDKEGTVIATVYKTLYVRNKKHKKEDFK